MTSEKFKMIHSDLIMEMQCIENDLRVLYATMKKGDFENNLDDLDKAGMGEILRELKKVDYSDNFKDISESEYIFLDKIREIRNYWCHQCYIDFVYIPDKNARKIKFDEISERLSHDESITFAIHQKIEKLKFAKLKEYNRV